MLYEQYYYWLFQNVLLVEFPQKILEASYPPASPSILVFCINHAWGDDGGTTLPKFWF